MSATLALALVSPWLFRLDADGTLYREGEAVALADLRLTGDRDLDRQAARAWVAAHVPELVVSPRGYCEICRAHLRWPWGGWGHLALVHQVSPTYL